MFRDCELYFIAMGKCEGNYTGFRVDWIRAKHRYNVFYPIEIMWNIVRMPYFVVQFLL